MADDFSPQIAALTAGVPIALLPVRIEARYVNNANELRIRVYPDQIHADAHERELTAAERDAGIVYWRAIFTTPDPKKRKTSPWVTLCRKIGAPRAAWVARALTPTNLAQLGTTKTPTFPTVGLKTAEWSKAARAALLPKRWLVAGYSMPVGWWDAPTNIRFNELFRKWSNEVSSSLDLTIAPDLSATSIPDGSLPLQPSARWLVDFDEAERVGMGVRITSADYHSGITPKDGIAQLYVLGVDWTTPPDDAAALVRDTMSAHVYTDGLSAIVPGTPTNVTAAATAGAAPANDMLVAALDPEQRPSAAQVAGGGADRLWRDLGFPLTPNDLLTAFPAANGNDQLITTHLVNALWEGTLGTFAIDQLRPVMTDALVNDVRDHARRYLQPGGHYPALRIGRQPYGILPIVAGRASVPNDTTFGKMVRWLRQAEGEWKGVGDRVPRMGRTADIGTELTKLLQRLPVSSTVRYRSLILNGTETPALTPFRNAQDAVKSMALSYLSLASQTMPFTSRFLHPATTRVGIPIVDPAASTPGARLSANYLQAIVDTARTGGTIDAIKARQSGAGNLLEALVAGSVARELHRADMRVINNYLLAANRISALPPIGVLNVQPFGFGSVWMPQPVVGTGVSLINHAQVSRVVIPSVTGMQTVRQYVTSKLAPSATVPDDFHVIDDVLRSIEWLGAQPADQLDRCFRGLLDAFSYRIDAWVTSIAARQLAEARVAHPTGVYIGAFGWLDGIKPAATSSSQGYVHAPSLAQAMTAAVLRSGHMAHSDAEHDAFDVNLTSERVDSALHLLDGVAQGQPLAALLGYRFERALRSHSLLLAKYILPFRRLVPLRAPDSASTAPATPSENVSARDVVDGVALLERWSTDRDGMFNALVPAPAADDRQVLSAVLDGLADAYDAVADVMVAESVHQTVLGNGERAGAVLAALDRQETPPSMDFVRTRRTGKSFTHRLLVLLGDETLPAPWSGIALDVRARAEPRLNAWIARLIGDPARVVIAASVTGATETSVTTTLAELAMSPLSLVMASDAPGKSEPSELEERLVARIASKLSAGTPETTIELLDAPPPGSDANVVGLGALRALLRWIFALVTTKRAATANDLALPQDAGDDNLDPNEIAARADALSSAFRAASTTLDSFIGTSPNAAPAAIRDALWAAAALGVRSAVPDVAAAGSPEETDGELLGQATRVRDTMLGSLAAEAALVTAFGTGKGKSVREVCDLHVARMRTLLGPHFPVLPRFTARNGSALTSSNADRATLLGGDELAPIAWVQRMALVRPGVDSLSRVLLGAEMLHGDMPPGGVFVVQLPRVAGESWLALPFGATAPDAEMSIVAASSGAVNFAKPLAGLVCDAWPEVVPSREENTAISFHYDTPGARAPQAVLLAAPPFPANTPWSVNALLESLMEARYVAQLRAVNPADFLWVNSIFPPIWMPASPNSNAAPTQLAGSAPASAASTPTAVPVLGKA